MHVHSPRCTQMLSQAKNKEKGLMRMCHIYFFNCLALYFQCFTQFSGGNLQRPSVWGVATKAAAAMASRRSNTMQQRKEPVLQQGEFGPWTVSSVKSHILESEGADRDRFCVWDENHFRDSDNETGRHAVNCHSVWSFRCLASSLYQLHPYLVTFSQASGVTTMS